MTCSASWRTSTRSNRRAAALLAALVLGTCAQLGVAQEGHPPDDPPAPPPPSATATPPPPAEQGEREESPFRHRWLMSLFTPRPGESDEQFRARLHDFVQRQLEVSKHRQERLETLSKLLEQGASPADIRQHFQEMMPFFAGMGGWGMGRGEQGPEGQGKTMDRFEELASLRPLPPDEPPMHHPAGEKPTPLTDEQKAFVNDFLQVSSPELLHRLKELDKREPAETPRRYERMFARLRWLKDLRDRDPDLYDLRLEDIRLARQAVEAARRIAKYDLDKKSADDPDRVKQMGVLRDSLKAQYQVRGKLLKHEIDKWQARLAQAQTDLTQRDQKEDDVVNQFMDSLIKHERDRLEHHHQGPPPEPHGKHGPPPPPVQPAR